MILLLMERAPEAYSDGFVTSEDILAHGSRAPETTATQLPRPARRCRLFEVSMDGWYVWQLE